MKIYRFPLTPAKHGREGVIVVVAKSHLDAVPHAEQSLRLLNAQLVHAGEQPVALQADKSEMCGLFCNEGTVFIAAGFYDFTDE